MALKILGFMVEVIKLAYDTFVEKPVKVKPVRKSRGGRNVWWIGAVLLGGVSLFILIRWLLKPLPPKAKTAVETVPVPEPGEPISMAPAPAHQPELPAISQLDDLTLISGIGPKTAAMLKEEGIASFQQLAGATQEQLEEMLHKRGFRIVNPATWPEQATLAAANDWEGLARFLENLKKK